MSSSAGEVGCVCQQSRPLTITPCCYRLQLAEPRNRLRKAGAPCCLAAAAPRHHPRKVAEPCHNPRKAAPPCYHPRLWYLATVTTRTQCLATGGCGTLPPSMQGNSALPLAVQGRNALPPALYIYRDGRLEGRADQQAGHEQQCRRRWLYLSMIVDVDPNNLYCRCQSADPHNC